MRIKLSIVLILTCFVANAQLAENIAMFNNLAEVEIDSSLPLDEWSLTTMTFPSGRKQDDIRIYISAGCKTNGKCNIKYQHQVYYDDVNSTIALKEGKYIFIKNGKVTYRHYGWWYSNKGKIYRRVEEKTTKKI